MNKRKYIFSAEEMEKIVEAKNNTKNKNIYRRLKVLELYAQNATSKEITEKTEYKHRGIYLILDRYIAHGLEYFLSNQYKGNHRNMSLEEEKAFIDGFKERAAKGEIITANEMKQAYIEKVGHNIGSGHIYYILARHEWRKVIPRRRHPKSAKPEEIEASKKLTEK